jgi:hypothetical protein
MLVLVREGKGQLPRLTPIAAGSAIMGAIVLVVWPGMLEK